MYDFIKEELEKQGKSFYWLSKQTGITEQAFYNMKERKSNLSVENVIKVSEALNVSILKLMNTIKKKGK